ncbi:MAG TPA: hypothetical protein VGM06_11180 [Polyangiaceae bacterium]|jgi:hypothetical protein
MTATGWRRTAEASLPGLALCLAAVVQAGCSVVNSFEPLAPAKDGGASVQDTTKQGVVAIGGYQLSDGSSVPTDYVLTALDPVNGTELPLARRQDITVASILYDSYKDLFYVFESGVRGHIFPLAGEPFYVHALRIDPFTGEWTELGATSIRPAYSFSTTVVLTDRIAYVAYGDTGALELDVLDTTEPSAITAQGTASIMAGISPVALLGNPVAGTAGSNQTVMLCWIQRPNLQMQSFTVPSSGDPQAPQAPSMLQANVGASVGLASILENGAAAHEVLAISSPTNGAVASVTLADITGANISPPFPFPFTDSNVEAPTFSTCHNTVFVSGTNMAKNVYAMPLASIRSNAYANASINDLTSQTLNYSGQGLYYEPYTDTVIAPFNQGGSGDLTALHVTWTSDGDPNPPETRQAGQTPLGWQQLDDVFTNFVATKVPSSGCPN